MSESALQDERRRSYSYRGSEGPAAQAGHRNGVACADPHALATLDALRRFVTLQTPSISAI